MNARTSDPRDLLDDSIWFSTSRARRLEHAKESMAATPRSPRAVSVEPRHGGRATTRPAHNLLVVVIAALVSVASLAVVAAWQDDAARDAAAVAAVPAAAAPSAAATTAGHAGIDHGSIAPDAAAVGDAETVEASIAAYER